MRYVAVVNLVLNGNSYNSGEIIAEEDIPTTKLRAFLDRGLLDIISDAVIDDDTSYATKTTTITAGTGLSGGGDLSANRTISVDFGTGENQVRHGNDSSYSTPVQKTLIDAKGDLIIGSAADAVDRLAVGEDGYVLTADAASSTGVKWATASGGGVAPDPTPQAGRWWGTRSMPDSNRTPPSSGVTCYFPFVLPSTVTITDIGCVCTQSPNASSIWRFGIYSDNSGKPGSLLASADLTLSTMSFITASVSATLTAGTLWWGWRANNQARTSTTKVEGVATQQYGATYWSLLTGTIPPGSNGGGQYFNFIQSTDDGNGDNVLPNTAVNLSNAGTPTIPSIWIKV